MPIILIVSLLLTTYVATAFAGGEKHQVMMYNDSNVDVAYWFGLDFTPAGGLKIGTSEVYTTGGRQILPGAEESVEVDAGTCTDFAPNGTCNVPVKMKSCIAGNWNLLKTKAIHISSPTTCTIVCDDGSATTCQATKKPIHVNNR